ncbi:catechol 2,3-dioxygenase-like lactoylglutathione lyase family enzyme [Enterococcus rotai]|uniref:Fosmidomycin resistance protein n=1 Tax=Enterococcus rotai TaxID=118060 RepID=A0A0U2LW09_9ENTE|nr:FosX/FosE/FosI family fosfomycin resistance hydrolase [Enterococcus rotai]ALS37061.1 fosmidomycin resistance protein [Enterococcus rotai]
MISHVTFIVQDLEKATLFFETIFDAKEVYSSGVDTFSIAQEKFFLIDDLWIAVMQGESLPTKTYNHIAFKITESDYETYLDKINSLGLEIRAGRPRIAGEASSIYFYDFDNHLFELHTGTLAERLKSYQSVSE